jgi:S-DNA-T family DNA segregation ATPase FtsK/SpoIIIE
MLELPMYNGVPHLLTDVVTDAKASVRSFKWALSEMERRYRILAARGCRNLASYNTKMDNEGPKEEGEEKLPYIVIIIDELADLMITSGREVEEPIARLAQTARAVGLHLIVATQRPSVDVITGVIKANFPARIAFQVASRTDSRTILDQNGAESLLGKGDMLFLPPGQASPLRVHGAYVSEEETQRLAEAWREQGQPEACAGLEEVLAEPEVGAGGLGDDPLFEDAARLVVAAGQASASLLQRRLKVGYARAARLVDMMEAAGLVAPQEGSKPREILVDQVHLEHVLAGEPR